MTVEDELTVGYLHFSEVPTSKLTRHWNVTSTSGSRLGVVKFFPRWHCFSFFPSEDTTFNAGCMRDLAEFCERATVEWRGRHRD